MGYDVPSPVLTHYDWAGGNPFSSQKSTAALLTLERRSYVLNGMGSGKTKSALWGWHYLRSNSVCGKMLVSAPLSTLQFTWARAIFNTLPGVNCAVLHGTKKQRLTSSTTPRRHLIINHDGYKVILDELMAHMDINVPASTSSRCSATALDAHLTMTKLANRMGGRGMTGSPIPNSPTDAWAQARLVTPSRVPKFFGRYRDELMTKITQFKYHPKPDAVDKAFATLQPSVRFTLDDVTELPECIERTVDVEMGPKQTKI
jgi:hypothetical protein